MEDQMKKRTRQENQLRIFMGLAGVTYFVVGFAFIIAPGMIFKLMNILSGWLTSSLLLIPMSVEKFWLSMTFSMMMTITVCSILVFYNVKEFKALTVPVLFAKAASACSAILIFALSDRYFAYLAIFLVDGTIFWITLILYLRANLFFFREQTIYCRDKLDIKEHTGPTVVSVKKGEDKFKLLDEVLEEAKFFEVLEKKYDESGKTKEDYKVVIKPNFMFMHSKRDHSSFTDPKLVEHLVDKIYEKGFTDITLVEAQSTYGNYYKNREVLKVAKYIDYSTDKNYRIVDLTLEKVPYDYGGRLGEHYVGITWRDADFRVSFAKNKTHIFANYTLTLKNIYGTLPCQNKLKEYHTKREYDWPTIESMKHFPVHFGLIDAFWSADGQLGVITDKTPNHTKTMIGGENLMAVDWVGAKKMGLDADNPRIGRYLGLAWEAFGKPEVVWKGDESVYAPWENVVEIFPISLDLVEEAYHFSNWMFAGLTSMDAYFEFKWTGIPILLFRKILAPIKKYIFKYGKM
jgi:uncharacterized protein (DUF362 family)